MLAIAMLAMLCPTDGTRPIGRPLSAHRIPRSGREMFGMARSLTCYFNPL